MLEHASRPDPCKEKKNATSMCFRGLVLQDLTFVHIGNNDLLPDGSINFSKRWQQFNIVENMKRFKKGQVPHYSVRMQICRWGQVDRTVYL
jgi:hypothetical protein